MSLAGFDLLLGARARLFAATMLVGCSGSPDDAASAGIVGDDAATAFDSRSDHSTDGLDASREGDASARPPDGARPDTSSGADAPQPDVAADVPALALCLRLDDPQNPNRIFQLSQAVDDQYLVLISGDCRVGNALHPPGGTPALAAWRNDLYSWNLDLWGCKDKIAAGFGLVSTAFQGVTFADAAQLIELYLNASTKVLELTSAEAADLRRDLEQLAKSVVLSESTSYSLSSCVSDASAEGDAPAIVDVVSSDAKEASSIDAEAGSSDAEAGEVDAEAEGGDEGGD